MKSGTKTRMFFESVNHLVAPPHLKVASKYKKQDRRKRTEKERSQGSQLGRWNLPTQMKSMFVFKS